MNSARLRAPFRGPHHGIAVWFLWAVAIVGVCGQPVVVRAQTKAQTGDWSPAPSPAPITFGAVHMALLPGDGDPYHSRIVVWSTQAQHQAELGWNPGAAGCDSWPYALPTLSSAWNLPVEIYCAAHVPLATGPGLLSAGGIETGHAWGIPDVFAFTPGSGTGPGAWSAQADLQQARYYGTVTSLRDGRILASGGMRHQQQWYFGGRVDGNPPTGGTGDLLHRFGRGTKSIWDPAVTPVEESPGDRPSPREGHTGVHFVRSENPQERGPYQAYFGGRDFSGVTTDNAVRLLKRENGGGLEPDYRYRWSKLGVSGDPPPARSDHIAIDLGGVPSQMAIYGGLRKSSSGAPATVLPDFWKLSKVGPNWQWSTLPTSGGPGPRYGHAAAYGASKLYVFGGSFNAEGELADNQVWVFTFDPDFSGGTWSVLPVPGVRPEPRRDHTLVLAQSSLLLYGGSGDVSPSSGALWKLDLGSLIWSEIPTDGPSPGPRANHSAIFESVIPAPRLVVFGGEPPTASDSLVDKHVYFINPFSLSPSTGKATWVRGPAAPYRLSGHALGNDPFEALHARIPEIFNPSGNVWTPQTGSGWLPPDDAIADYPVQFLVPGTSLPGGGGRLLRVGRDPVARYLDIPATGIAGPWQNVPNGDNNDPPPPFTPLSGVQYAPGKVLVVGGKPSATGDDRARTLDATQIATASWLDRPGMAYRTDPNILMLPNGKVLVVGDITCPQIWDPVTGSWTSADPCALDPEPISRGYHSTAMLLPDGRVISSGGGGGPVPLPDLYVYCPPYLFNGDELAPRPTITSAPASIVYGEWFVIGKPATDAITSICLIRPAAVTHSFDMNGRYVPLETFEVLPGGTGLRVLAPLSGSVAPPGDYLLFILTNDVPSIAKWIHLGNCDPAPCDSDSPPVTTDLTPDLVGPNEVWLVWTAPGDDTTPLAGAYDLRYATTPVASESAYEAASLIADEPPVAAAGAPMSYVKYGLAECTEYSFALKTRDGRGNGSLRSNPATTITTCGGGAGGGFSARRASEEGAGGASASGAVSGGEPGGTSAGLTASPGGAGEALLTGATTLAPAAGRLVAETRRVATEGWEVTLRLVGEPDDFDPALGGAIVSQRREAAGDWKTLGRHEPWAGAGPLGLCALREHGRLVLPAGYGLERVAGAVRAGGEELVLARAAHSRLGALDAAPLASGGGVELALDDALTLSYAPSPEAQPGATSWYLLVRAAETSGRWATRAHRLPGAGIPTRFALHPNQPNPFRGTTTIRFDLPVASPLALEVFDPQGRRVATLAQGEHAAGRHTVEWNLREAGGAPARPGLYLYRLTAGAFQAQRKLSVLP